MLYISTENLKRLKFNLKIGIFTGKGVHRLAILTKKNFFCPTPKKMNKTATRRFSIFADPSKKSVVQQIAIDLTLNEAKSLEQYCEQTGKAAEDVIRELICGLPVT
ncbi:hypothetical protein VB735_30300 [Halotia wernerae UHCC 0503]|nr:hypothetical protein [Halotia wernerae UHCC 0503]